MMMICRVTFNLLAGRRITVVDDLFDLLSYKITEEIKNLYSRRPLPALNPLLVDLRSESGLWGFLCCEFVY